MDRLYEPLNPALVEIRLLDLLPSKKPESDIQCKLRTVSLIGGLQQSGGFEALSYTWGDPTIQKHIIVNDQQVKVTQNLETFLRQRRHDSETVSLWVDAVCINQQDLDEKNAQIPLMNLIYAFANRLTVWLGPEADDSSHAMETLHDLGSTSPYEKLGLLSHRSTQALQKLLGRPWWTRVWIIQELAIGGMGIKIDRLELRCGPSTIPWRATVVAAARIRAHQDDLRQPFPNITNILELDSLRETAHRFLQLVGRPISQDFSFDLLCRYRHFAATNPRDKLYAIINMFARHARQQHPTRYDVDVRDVFIAYAVHQVTKSNASTNNSTSDVDGDAPCLDALEILRHCGPNTRDIPSWVPDWSTPLPCIPLPARRLQRHFDVPWWSEPIEVEPHQLCEGGTILPAKVKFPSYAFPRDVVEDTRLRNTRLVKLEIAAKGFGVITDLDEIPSGFTFHNQTEGQGIPESMREMFQNMLKHKMLTLAVCDPREAQEEHENRDAVRRGEVLTERRIKSWLLREIGKGEEEKPSRPYSAGGDGKAEVAVNLATGALNTGGVWFDEIEVCGQGFVDEVDGDWENATHFMVEVGKCKALAVGHSAAIARYPQPSALLEAFWNTLFVGQVAHPDVFEMHVGENDAKKLRYEEWLPTIPETWKFTAPQVTSTTTGLVEMAATMEAVKLAQEEYDARQHGPESLADATKEVTALEHPEFSPDEWSSDDKEKHKTALAELASLWHKQPYDLYHRPFAFLHMVPDPYWETRRTDDRVALRITQEWSPRPIVSLPLNRPEDKLEPDRPVLTPDMVREWKEIQFAKQTAVPSIVPQGTFAPGMEKYSLGRKFFITKSGRFGLGPKDAKLGDRMAVIVGSSVPFVLRNTGVNETGKETWQLIGECYVHGVMKGEVMAELESGTLKLSSIIIQ